MSTYCVSSCFLHEKNRAIQTSCKSNYGYNAPTKSVSTKRPLFLWAYSKPKGKNIWRFSRWYFSQLSIDFERRGKFPHGEVQDGWTLFIWAAIQHVMLRTIWLWGSRVIVGNWYGKSSVRRLWKTSCPFLGLPEKHIVSQKVFTEKSFGIGAGPLYGRKFWRFPSHLEFLPVKLRT